MRAHFRGFFATNLDSFFFRLGLGLILGFLATLASAAFFFIELRFELLNLILQRVNILWLSIIIIVVVLLAAHCILVAIVLHGCLFDYLLLRGHWEHLLGRGRLAALKFIFIVRFELSRPLVQLLFACNALVQPYKLKENRVLVKIVFMVSFCLVTGKICRF